MQLTRFGPVLFFPLALSLPAFAQLSVQEYLIPRAQAFPHDPAFGDDGIVWYTDQENSYIGRLDPETGMIVDYPTPTPNSGPHGICVAPDGFVWYTAQDSGRLGKVDPATGMITEYVMPANANRPHTPVAHQGYIWFTAQNNSTYARFNPVSLQTNVYPVSAGWRPYGIVPALDGYLWIAFFGTNRLGRVDPSNGALQTFPLPSSSARPRRLAAANNGHIWYTDFARGYLGRLDPGTGNVVEWPAPDTPPGPYGIAVGTDSRIWFHAQGSSYMIAFDPRTQQFATVPIPTSGSIVRHMVCDYVRGNLWLALSGTRRIGKLALGPPIEYFGDACAGAAGTPELTIDGAPRIGESMTIGVAPTSAPLGTLYLGTSDQSWLGIPLPLDLAIVGSNGCFIHSAWTFALYGGAPTSVVAPLPIDGTLAGLELFFQWALWTDPSGLLVVTTEAARATVIGV